MSDNNEVVVEIEPESEEDSKPDFIMDESEIETEESGETDERTIEIVEAELENLKAEYKKQLEEIAEKEREQYEAERERLLRTVAESENTKRRVESEAQKQLKYANKTIIEGLIPVLDSFEAAIKSVDDNVESSDDKVDFSNFCEGVHLVHKQLLDVLKIHGLIQVQASAGCAFDPNLHEAVFATESDDIPEGSIIEEFRCGYRLHDQVVRAAQVVVSKGEKIKEDSSEENQEQEENNATEQSNNNNAE